MITLRFCVWGIGVKAPRIFKPNQIRIGELHRQAALYTYPGYCLVCME